MSEMLERVARAMAPMFAEANNYHCNGLEWPECEPTCEARGFRCVCKRQAMEAARAAIAALREPTEAMVEAAIEADNTGMPLSMGYDEAWSIMIDAALNSKT